MLIQMPPGEQKGWLIATLNDYIFISLCCMRAWVAARQHVRCFIVGLPTYSSRIVSAAKAVRGAL